MNIRPTIKRHLGRLAFIFAVLAAVSLTVSAQTDTVAKKRLHGPATARGTVGGEAHKSYVIRARKGQTLRVNISWRRAGDNRAEFTVSRQLDFFSSAPVKFGKEADKGNVWAGKIPKTGDYYIYVVAHPTARYTLRAKLR